MHPLSRLAWLVPVALFAALPAVPPARGCAPVPPRGSSVSIASESALILWDAKTKTEHFIRRGTFHTDSKDFGFLVPTPTQPETPLVEVDDSIFNQLEDWTKPEIVYRKVPGPPGGGRG